MHATNSDPALHQTLSPFLPQLASEAKLLGLRDIGVLVGVSGGADSVSLLRGLDALAQARLRIVAAHLNHGMRPRAAEDDAVWIGELCGRLGIPIIVEKADVPAYAKEHRLNVEEAARTVRYQFLDRAARAEHCTHLAVAHTADDQVETVLHHLFRGTGLAGLRGMPVIRPLGDGLTLVRPLLGVRRTQIEAWLGEIGQDFRTDVTNSDESRTRNRIRHTVLPVLEHELGPQVRETLLRMAEQARELQSTIQELAAAALKNCLEDESADVVRLNAALLADRPRHLVREVFVELWKRKNWPRQAMGFADWDRLGRLARAGGAETLPGNIEARRRGSLIVLRRRAAHG